jgi:hypothetical protein
LILKHYSNLKIYKKTKKKTALPYSIVSFTGNNDEGAEKHPLSLSPSDIETHTKLMIPSRLYALNN